jgi:hypothetical protein
MPSHDRPEFCQSIRESTIRLCHRWDQPRLSLEPITSLYASAIAASDLVNRLVEHAMRACAEQELHADPGLPRSNSQRGSGCNPETLCSSLPLCSRIAA